MSISIFIEMCHPRLLFLLTVLAVTAVVAGVLPMVDLGYEIHQALTFNVGFLLLIL